MASTILSLGTGCSADGGRPTEVRPRLPSADDVRADVAGLDGAALVDRVFEVLLARSPEAVIELGLEAELDVGGSFLDDVSDEALAEQQAVERVLAERVAAASVEGLDDAVRLSLEVQRWWLDDRVRGHALSDLAYRVSPMLTSVVASTELFFTDVHPLRDEADARAWARRLWDVETKLDATTRTLTRLAGAGFVAPRLLVEISADQVRTMAHTPARSTRYVRAFEGRLETLALDASLRAELVDAAVEALDEAVLPAYARLAAELDALAARAPEAIGVSQYPRGLEHYRRELFHHTTEPVTEDELHALGLAELERIHGELEARFVELGIDAEGSITRGLALASQRAGVVASSEVVAEYTRIIRDAEVRSRAVFDALPDAPVEVVGAPSGGFYVGPSLDGTRPGKFFATVSSAGEARLGMRTLAHHEAVPGHHLQIAFAQSLELPLFRRVVTFTAHVEGWALYAEWLASELGWYDDDALGDVGRLQAEAFRAARLVVDTGIHARGWTFDEAVSFFSDATGHSRRFAEGQIIRYAAWPGQATAYAWGARAIRGLRGEAVAALGEDFDDRAFHGAVLSAGSVPLGLLAREVRAALALPDR